MEALFELLFQHHPEFKNEIIGCKESEIETLAKLVTNTKMPEDYKTFLKYMGRNLGRVYGIRRRSQSNDPEINSKYMNQEIKIDFYSVLRFYKELHKHKRLGELDLPKDYGEKTEDFFLFGIDCLGNDNGHLFLDLRYPDLPVVEISGTIAFKQHSPSFRAFLFEIPFKRVLSTYEYSKRWM